MSPEDLLRGRGLHRRAVRARHGPSGFYEALGSGEADIAGDFAAQLIIQLDRGRADRGPGRDPRRLLRAVRHRAGPHDPRPERARPSACAGWIPPPHVFLASMAAYVGLDPRKDITWVDASVRRVDAAPGRGQDRCVHRVPAGAAGAPREADRPRRGQQRRGPALVAVLLLHGRGNREFVRKHPVATKRALRAILKAADICALEPERAAQALVDRGLRRSATTTRSRP